MLRFVSLLLFTVSFTGLCDAQSVREISMCQGDTAIMSAVVSDADSIQWYYNDHPVPDTNNDTLRSAKEGMFYLMAFSENGKCFDRSDFIRVKISYPAAVDDHYALTLGKTEALNVLNNDNEACFAFNLSTITITQPPVVGSIVSITNGMIVYKASNSLLLPDNFTYRITDMEGRTTNEARVNIDVELNCALLYPNPVQHDLNIIVDPQKTHAINVYDASGKRLAEISPDKVNLKFDMSGYAQGIYLFEIIKRNEKGCTLKVQKDK